MAVNQYYLAPEGFAALRAHTAMLRARSAAKRAQQARSAQASAYTAALRRRFATPTQPEVLPNEHRPQTGA